MTFSTKAVTIAVSGILLGGLAGASPAQAQRPVDMANPASAFCVAQGGRTVLRGAKGYCHLPDGRVIEEWAFYRQQNDRKDRRDTVVGMSDPAAAHCIAVAGRPVTRRDRNGGQASFCRLKNGRTVDAWKLYRESDGRATEASTVLRYCTATGGALISNDDGTHGCRTREGDVFGAGQYYDMHHKKRD